MYNQRKGLITGSRCAPLVPKRSAEKGIDTLARVLAREMYFDWHESATTEATEHGNVYEQDAFRYYNENIQPIQPGRWIQKGFCGGSTDAEGDGFGVDFKCPFTLDGWLNKLYDEPDDIYYHQAQMYMYLTEKPIWYIAYYLTETLRMNNNSDTYPVDWSKRMIIHPIHADADWVDRMLSAAPKVIELRDMYLTKLEQKFGKK